jgi:hypothetical protein
MKQNMKNVSRKTVDHISNLIAKLRAKTEEMQDVTEKFRKSSRQKAKRRGRR